MTLDLDTVYQKLDFESGELFKVASWQHVNGNLNKDEFLNRDKWFKTCLHINNKYKSKGFQVDAIFFIQQNPIAVFAKVEKPDNETKKLAVRVLWNLARPRYLFLQELGTTEAYDLGSNLDLSNPKPCAKGLAELVKINREVIQSGYDLLRGSGKRQTADIKLINDLKELRRILVEKGKGHRNFPALLDEEAHTLIAQVIFIRYLEDRNILDEDYFRKRVAKSKKKWNNILSKTTDRNKAIKP